MKKSTSHEEGLRHRDHNEPTPGNRNEHTHTSSLHTEETDIWNHHRRQRNYVIHFNNHL